MTELQIRGSNGSVWPIGLLDKRRLRKSLVAAWEDAKGKFEQQLASGKIDPATITGISVRVGLQYRESPR